MPTLEMPMTPSFAPSGCTLHNMVTRGDIYHLGNHKLMCGDATSKADVAKLFGTDKPTLVVTSPPYAKQRDYDRSIPCWDSMMLGALNAHGFADDVQMLVNLGSFHRKGEVIMYWHEWVKQMRLHGWMHHAQYIWHKTVCLPHAVKSRLTPNFEYILHLTKKPRNCVASIPTIGAGDSALIHKSRQRKKDGTKAKQRAEWKRISDKKLQGAVISTSIVHPKEATEHPAQMPSSLPRTLIKSFNFGDVIAYDPFSGSGTTIIACEAEGVTGLGMEISESYCAIVIERWNKAHPDKQAKKL